MVELEIDGRKVEVPDGSMVMHAANKLDIYVPHFCYHKKLSIAANCRMCLVDVEKAPKPLPACATPVSNGMKVFTHSERAIKAQQGVMEFLLINHPLDCPICDQGGECQLQDLAVGYGASASRYTEEKRVVFHKSMGPLISAEEMSRCIHCTRCVRFGQEIAGVMELGMVGRGEHSEIVSFVGRSVDSELSGNMIDVCPVGALTSKPFRYSARTWELSRRKSVAPHDSLGSNLVVQVKNNQVMRVVPLEDDSLNECWLSDKDRFSYEGLNSPERLRQPMLKQDGVWHTVDWPAALEYAAHSLAAVKREFGAGQIGALGSPHSTVEELFLLGKVIRGLGSENIDSRLRQSDFSLDGGSAGVPWLGMTIEAVSALDSLFVIGSFLRKDHPLMTARIRQAAKHGCQVSLLHAVDEDPLLRIGGKIIVAPSQWVAALSGVLVALLQAKNQPVPAEFASIQPTGQSKVIAAGFAAGQQSAVLLGNAAVQHAQFGRIAVLAKAIADASGAAFGYLTESANTVGAHLAGAVPRGAGLDARRMVEQALRAYVLLNVEPEYDHGMPWHALTALGQASSVVALSMFKSADLLEVADCLLPITPFTETSGTFVNCEGRVQSFNGVVRPAGEARPAWKVLRVLGNLLGLPGFDYEASEPIRDQALAGDVSGRLSNSIGARPPAASTGADAAVFSGGNELERIADVPIYSADPLVRRAASLQLTRDALPAKARMNSATLARIGAAPGELIRFTQGHAGEALVEAAHDESVAEGVVRLAAAVPATGRLVSLTGMLRAERG